ncbi:VOC family protein [Agromyces aerolatus]|uniref:VOC family protein n=1 Tax=Agromyces sp. LY-1074 TaxID=3074080 RepID=UPI00285E6846|nr:MULTISPECIES: VOC family protein [unclassified Agromyces]MDR5699815.1 VOC family protein [Agromyces sp. LY-1074]MDR5706373.1 VOC family protein [Agromyces sp. LY-1358]
MFENASAYAVLPASDLDRARRYWTDLLGNDPEMSLEDEAFFITIGGVRVLVYRTQFAGTAQNTVLGIESDDLDGDMERLRGLGIEFNQYDLPGLTTVDDVAEVDGLRTAWFTDSEGNIVAIGDRVQV